MSSELNIVKAICKISSALSNLDEINDENSKYFTGKLRRDFNKFFDFFLHHTADMTSQMYENSVEAWEGGVYHSLDGYELSVEADTEELKHFGIMLAKVQSAALDLKKVDRTMQNKLFVDPLLNRISPLVSKGNIRRLPISDQGMSKLVNSITEVIDSIILS